MIYNDGLQSHFVLVMCVSCFVFSMLLRRCCREGVLKESAFEEMMNSYYSGKEIKRVPYERTLQWIVKEIEEDDPPSPARRWRKG